MSYLVNGLQGRQLIEEKNNVVWGCHPRKEGSMRNAKGQLTGWRIDASFVGMTTRGGATFKILSNSEQNVQVCDPYRSGQAATEAS